MIAASMLVVGCSGAKHSDLFDPPLPVEVPDGGEVNTSKVVVRSRIHVDGGQDSVDSGVDTGICICNVNASPPEMCNGLCTIGYACLAEEGTVADDTYRSWYQTCNLVDPAHGDVYVGGSNICAMDEAGYMRGCLMGNGQTESCQINVVDGDSGALVSKSGHCVK